MSLFAQDYRLLLLLAIVGVVSLSTVLFAVSALSLRLRNIHTRRLRDRLEHTWEPIILDVLAGDLPAERVWSSVPASRTPWLIEYLLRVARRVRGEDLDVLARIASPYLDRIARRLRHRSVEQRAFAVETLNLLGRGAYRREIAATLDDRAPLVAMIAARALARKGEPDYLEAILDHLHRFETWSPRLLASLLASIGPAAGPVLRRALTDPQRPLLVRTLAASALLQLNDLEAADCAVDVLERDGDRELLAASLRLLGKVGRPEQTEPARVLTRSDDFVVRAHALTALARLGAAEDAPRLRAALDDPSSWVAIHAANGLKIAGHLTQLRELAASDHPRAELARQVLSEAV